MTRTTHPRTGPGAQPAAEPAAGAATGPGALVELLWGVPARPRRGPRRSLDLDAIAAAGVAVADADGLAAVTMQRVAAAVGVTKMALYRYVPGKDELVALMTEAALGAPPAPDAAAGGWRRRLDAWARAMHDRFVRHPWTLETTLGPRVVGPRELAWMEEAVAALDGTGLRGAERLDVAATVAGHVRAMAAQRAAAAHDRPESAFDDAIASVLAGHEGRFPAVAAALGQAVGEGPQDDALAFGLRCILDGVGLLIDARS